MLPEDIRNMDFGQASMPHAPEAQTPEVPYDTTASAPDRPAIPLSPDMLSGNLQGNGSEKSGIEFSFDAFGYTQQVELVQESYADGNLAVTAYLSDPTDESHDCASGSAVLETCDTTRAEQPMNHAKGVR